MSFIYFVERSILESALEMFKKNTLEFEDCYNIAFYKNYNFKEFATFDKKIRKSVL
jgi:predicted nucleic acid-binding protein